jgi:uncharacterized protein (DUF305 family)
MTPSYIHGGVAALLVGIAVLACSSAGRGVTQTAQPAAGGQGNTPAIGTAPVDSARYSYTPADVHFMSTMIGHHAQAIVMARWAATHDASPSIRILAERIINAQQDEIAIMQQWLRDRGQPVPEPHPSGMKVIVNGVEHEHPMPGMLTEDQMKQLDRSRGKEFDRLFLQFMIQHHRGAVSMVKDLISSPGAAHDNTVFKLASDINVDQTTEIDRMQKMLVGLLFEPSSP